MDKKIAPTGRIADLLREGQSLWLDSISRHLMDSGELDRLIGQVGVRGITSNPTIFEKAINGSSDYDTDIVRLAAEGQSPTDIIRRLMVDDVRRACDFFRPVYESSKTLDGFVSIEVNPLLAHETAASVAEARTLHRMVDRPNLLVKIPGTDEGIPAIRQLISEGISVNVTLLFSPEAYKKSARAYIEGLETYAAGGGDPSRIRSVASLFISRLDTLIDKKLSEIDSGATDPALARKARELMGKAGIANTRIVYELFGDLFSPSAFGSLSRKGAVVQRPLWASTGTKNPAYPDTLYVDNLIGPDTVNTVPGETLQAFADHGTVARTIDKYPPSGGENPHAILDGLATLGLSLEAAYNQLITEGVAAFNKSFESLLESTSRKIAAKKGS
ncbi:MAG: transaldolase [Leptospirillia bacterium]